MASRDLSPTALRLTQEFAPDPRLLEPRSFARTAVEVEPITTSRPTNADLAKGFNQLHTCHEDTKATVERIAGAMGLDEHGKRVAGLSTPRQAFIRSTVAVIMGVSAFAVLTRIAVAVWPYLFGALKAVWMLILGGKV